MIEIFSRVLSATNVLIWGSWAINALGARLHWWHLWVSSDWSWPFLAYLIATTWALERTFRKKVTP